MRPWFMPFAWRPKDSRECEIFDAQSTWNRELAVRANRRRDFRFHPPNVRVTATNLRLTLLDLGRSGMNVESQGPATVASGDELLFRLHDGPNVVDVLGQARWVASPSGEMGSRASRTIRQKIGVAFLEVISESSEGMWKNLVARREPLSGDDGVSTIEDRDRDGATLTPPEGRVVWMIEPRDGDAVTTPVIKVVGEVAVSSEVLSVSINGAPAALEGSRFRLRVRLKAGPNKISAMVHKSTGGYNTYLLGTVTLDPRWRESRHRLTG